MTAAISPKNDLDILGDLIAAAKKSGADAADAMLIDASALSVGMRLGKLESLEHSETGDLGLRVFIGKKQAMVSASDRSQKTLTELVDRAVQMARLAPDDPYCGLADPADITKEWPQLESADSTDLSAEQLISQVREAEETALAVKGITNSDGVDAGASRSHITLVSSNGFSGQFERSNYSLSVSVLAGEGTGMERDYDYASCIFFQDMPSPTSIGKHAAERTIRRLNPRKMPTGQFPVVFEDRVAGSLVAQLASAINGASIARGISFLKDKMGQAIFPASITIVDDPFRARGLRSRPFDGEGILPQPRAIIDKGILTSWLLDQRSARQLGLRSTGHAVRSPGSVPSPSASNLYMEAGQLSVADLIKDIKQGFYVTETMGMGVSTVTGDYSQAAAGYWIENGEIAFSVNEMTIAGNMRDMFLNITAANDLEWKRGIDSPTLRIEGMTVAGL